MADDRPAEPGGSGAEHRPDHRKPSHPGMANLRPPWRPGESGNPNGRKRKQPITDAIERILAGDKLAVRAGDQVRTIKAPDGQTLADMLAGVIVGLAFLGKPEFVRLVYERSDGLLARPAPEPPVSDADDVIEIAELRDAAYQPSGPAAGDEERPAAGAPGEDSR